MLFKATYSRWLKTHNREHPGYATRKSFPWHILSRINFHPNQITTNKICILNKLNIMLGHVTFDYYLLRSDNRYQFDITVEDLRNLTIKQFRVVFSFEGILITIYPIREDKEANIINQFLQGNFNLFLDFPTPYLAKQILKIAVESLLKETFKEKKFIKDNAFSGVEIDDVFLLKAKELNRSLKKRKNYTIDFSLNREVWIMVSLFDHEAQALTYKYAHQCNNFLSLYLIKSKKILDPNIFYNSKVISVFNYFNFDNKLLIKASLSKLADLIVSYKKFP